jgi:hypothetical protein
MGGGEDKIRPKFESSGAEAQTNEVVKGSTGGVYGSTINTEGNLELKRTGVSGPLTEGQQAFVDKFNEIADSPSTINVYISQKDVTATVGNFETGVIDIDDVSKFGNGPYETAGGALTLELREQYLKIEKGVINHTDAHKQALPYKNAVNGRLDGGVIRKSGNNTTGGVITTVSLNNAGKNPQYINATIKNGNVIKVSQ